MSFSIDLSRLQGAMRRMGATPAGTMPPRRSFPPLKPVDIDLETGIELVKGQFPDNESGLLVHQGRQVLLYIQDHKWKVSETLENGSKGNRFHLAHCVTLETMRKQGRYQRYVITTRMDGRFFISGYDQRINKELEGDAALRVCKNCLGRLNYKTYRTLPGKKKDQLVESFDIPGFFATYSSHFKHLPSRWAGAQGREGYKPDWGEISNRVREAAGYRCQECAVDLSRHPRLLHTHHIDGVRTNNRRQNLKALCVLCHRRQPQHQHLIVREADRKTIHALRREQGTAEGGNWAEVSELADRAVMGLVAELARKHAPVPKVGLDLIVDGHVIANLELAWPKTRRGVGLTKEDLQRAKEAGWTAVTTDDALSDVPGFVAALMRRSQRSFTL